MALTVETLNQAKALLESGKRPMQIKNELALDVKPVELMSELRSQFGVQTINSLLQASRPNASNINFSNIKNIVTNQIANRQNLTVADVDVMIDNLNLAINELITVKSNIDVTP